MNVTEDDRCMCHGTPLEDASITFCELDGTFLHEACGHAECDR